MYTLCHSYIFRNCFNFCHSTTLSHRKRVLKHPINMTSNSSFVRPEKFHPYRCDQCNKGFIEPSKLKKHMSTHSDVRPFECDQCNKGFIEPSKLKKHTLNHSDVKPYRCDRCKKGFIEPSKLKRHMLTHNDGRL